MLYEGEVDGWRTWSGRSTSISGDGVPLNGHTTARARQLSMTGNLARVENIGTIVADDGSRLTAHTVGTIDRTNGAVDLRGMVTEATGSFAHLLGQSVTRTGFQRHPAGPFVPGQTRFDGVFTVNSESCAPTPPQRSAALGRDQVEAPRRLLAPSVTTASLQLVPPRSRLS